MKQTKKPKPQTAQRLAEEKEHRDGFWARSHPYEMAQYMWDNGMFDSETEFKHWVRAIGQHRMMRQLDKRVPEFFIDMLDLWTSPCDACGHEANIYEGDSNAVGFKDGGGAGITCRECLKKKGVWTFTVETGGKTDEAR